MPLPAHERIVGAIDRVLAPFSSDAQLRVARRQAKVREIDQLTAQADLPLLSQGPSSDGRRRPRSHTASPSTVALLEATSAYLRDDNEPDVEALSDRELGRRVASYAQTHGIAGADFLDPESGTMRELMRAVQRGAALARMIASRR